MSDADPSGELLSKLDRPDVSAGLELHQSLLQQWNPKLNLSRVVDDEASARKHFLESILTGTLIQPSESKVVDLGSGAGFPGVPIGVVWPTLSVTLLESDVRKSVFLKEVTRSFPNIEVKAQRGDAFAKSKPSIDLVISRAVTWSDLSRLSIALGCPLIWITSEAEFAKADTTMFHVARRIHLPADAGIAVRMFHVKPQTEVLR